MEESYQPSEPTSSCVEMSDTTDACHSNTVSDKVKHSECAEQPKQNESASEQSPAGKELNGAYSMDTECIKSDSTNTVDGNDEETAGTENCDSEYCVRLTDLPSEVLFYLASFLDSRDIVESLCQVCQYLHDLFSNQRYWKTRINLRWPKPYPILPREDFDWCTACMEREEVHKRWSKPEEHFHHVVCRDGFSASVDVVHLMKEGRYLAAGSRDRYVNVMDLSRYDCDNPDTKKDMLVFSNGKIHKGWVWSMASYDDTLLTGSWDTHIKFWDLGQGSVEAVADVKLKTAILGLYAEPGFVAACAYDKRLYMFDPRAPTNTMTQKRYHTKPLLCVAGDNKYVITGSEDKVVSIYDRTAGKNFKKIETDSFVMDLSYGKDQLWVGDKEGHLKVIDARHALFDENNIQTFETGHKGKVMGVVYTDGGIFTSSTDATVKVLEPTLDPQALTTLTTHEEAVAGISYQNGILATAGTDISVGVWLPKTYKFQ